MICCSVLQRVAACCGVLQSLDSFIRVIWLILTGDTTYKEDLQYAERCSVLQCVAVCCSVLQCVAACCTMTHSYVWHDLQKWHTLRRVSHGVAVCCRVLQCVAVCCRLIRIFNNTCTRDQHYAPGVDSHRLCCSVLQCVAVCCSVLQCIAMCCSVLQCFAVFCSVLQWPTLRT